MSPLLNLVPKFNPAKRYAQTLCRAVQSKLATLLIHAAQEQYHDPNAMRAERLTPYADRRATILHPLWLAARASVVT